MMTEVFLVAGVRTAIGAFGGTLKDFPPGDLAARVTAEAVRRSTLPAKAFELVVFGNVIHTEPRDMYISRVAAIDGGLPQEVPTVTLNRLCGSGLQAILTAANAIRAGDADVAVAGGAENMSRAPYSLPAARWGQRMGDAQAQDMLNGALSDPFHRVLMGVTAENVAERHGITRSAQDALALESHRRASLATTEGRFSSQILPLEIKTRKGTVSFDRDEHIRHDVTEADLAKLRPAFRKENGTVTAGNASGINDGAAAVVLASAEAVRRHGLMPLARLVAAGHAGVDPAYMGIGPVPATRKALDRAGLKIADLDVIEANEAFAAQACAVANELGFDIAKVNPNGSGIALGHPIGATGAINTVKAVYELQRTGTRFALITMCIGGGQGIAAILERV